jgi:hypothetical protein
MKLRHTGTMLMVLGLSIVTVIAGLNICSKCGYENSDAAVQCKHCKTVFPGKDKPAGQPEDNLHQAQQETHKIALQMVKREIDEARKQLQNENYELARFFFLNALSLEGLTEPTDHVNRSQKLLEQIKSTEAAARKVQKPCPRCDGTGLQTVKFEGLDSSGSGQKLGSGNSLRPQRSSGVRCKKCGGKGTVLAIGTIEDLKFARGKAESEYRTLQQARRYEPLGGAWIPPQLIDKLTAREKATIMRVIGMPCEECAGYGRVDCKDCDGTGRIICEKCDNGRIPFEESSKGIKRVGENRTKACPECKGVGSLPCSRCNEEGSIACKDCGGSGEADICNSCTGRGYITCKKCKGTKEYRGEPCATCKAEGFILCTSCKGTGRRD